jgi:hypothetical protein
LFRILHHYFCRLMMLHTISMFLGRSLYLLCCYALSLIIQVCLMKYFHLNFLLYCHLCMSLGLFLTFYRIFNLIVEFYWAWFCFAWNLKALDRLKKIDFVFPNSIDRIFLLLDVDACMVQYLLNSFSFLMTKFYLD